MICNLAVIKGDGIGPEIVTEAMKVLDAVGEKYGHTFNYEQLLMGGCSIDVNGVPLTDETVDGGTTPATPATPVIVAVSAYVSDKTCPTTACTRAC